VTIEAGRAAMSEEFDYHKSFALGHSYNQKVAKRLQDNGVSCYAPDLRFAQSVAERFDFTQNEKDVVLNNLLDGWLEVKSSSTYWEDGDVSSIRSDFSSLFVDTVSSYQGKLIKPMAYILVSQHTDGMLVVPVSTQPHWGVKKNLYDKQRDLYDDFYLVEHQHLKTFNELLVHIKKQLDSLQGV